MLRKIIFSGKFITFYSWTMFRLNKFFTSSRWSSSSVQANRDRWRGPTGIVLRTNLQTLFGLDSFWVGSRIVWFRSYKHMRRGQANESLRLTRKRASIDHPLPSTRGINLLPNTMRRLLRKVTTRLKSVANGILEKFKLHYIRPTNERWRQRRVVWYESTTI